MVDVTNEAGLRIEALERENAKLRAALASAPQQAAVDLAQRAGFSGTCWTMAASPPPMRVVAISQIEGYIGPPTLDRVVHLRRGDVLYAAPAPVSPEAQDEPRG